MDALLKMEKLLNEKFEIPSKNATPEQPRGWRSNVSPVMNPKRRFRNVADLDKRLEVEEMKKENRVRLKANRAQNE